MESLPPLNALRAFEAAARHLSFTRAGKELCVTAAAVSQQVRLLEEWLGMPLFQRRHRSLALTQAGGSYLPYVRDGLERLAEATGRLLASDERSTLWVGAMASFASQWLVPRLSRFRHQHPAIDVCLSTAHHLSDSEFEDVSDRLVDFTHRSPDVTIRYGRGSWAGLQAEKLAGEQVFPVCSPTVLHGPIPLAEPAHLSQHTLLHDVLPEDWGQWLSAVGVSAVDSRRGPIFSHSHDMIRAALLGQGVGLGRSLLVQDDVAQGRLVRPFAEEIPARFSYYLVCAATVADRPKIQAFRQWLLEEMARASDEGDTATAP
jgi:LysR family glycine cleavage system transcriptional activator